jgi:hypothetical protein
VIPWGDGRRDEPNAFDLRAVAAYGQLFEQPGFDPGGWLEDDASDLGLLTWRPSEPVLAWLKAIEEHRLLLSFDWTSVRWSRRMRRYREDPSALQSADLRSVRKVLTTVAHGSRHSDGLLQAMFESGVVQASLRRLNELSLQAV